LLRGNLLPAQDPADDRPDDHAGDNRNQQIMKKRTVAHRLALNRITFSPITSSTSSTSATPFRKLICEVSSGGVVIDPLVSKGLFEMDFPANQLEILLPAEGALAAVVPGGTGMADAGVPGA